MSKFYGLGIYSEESYGGLIQNPEQDRKAVAEVLANAMGVKIISMDFLRGPYDFIVEIESDNFENVAAMKMALEAQGAVELEILEAIDINSIAKKAGTAINNYTPPSE
mgnify:FL=1|jgi:uncharacterized protein with GYD domain